LFCYFTLQPYSFSYIVPNALLMQAHEPEIFYLL